MVNALDKVNGARDIGEVGGSRLFLLFQEPQMEDLEIQNSPSLNSETSAFRTYSRNSSVTSDTASSSGK